MAEVLDRRVYAEGEVIFKEGEVGRRCAFLIESGKVEITKRKDDGTDTVLGYIPQGGIFGEMALIDDSPRMAQARAVAPTAVVIVSEAMLEGKLKKADPFIRGLLNLLVRNLRQSGNRLAGKRGG
jgi:CRP/FNR family cyclic AMP-dependent transcriptional regulator